MAYCENESGEEACVVAWDVITWELETAAYFWLAFILLVTTYWLLTASSHLKFLFRTSSGMASRQHDNILVRWKAANPRGVQLLLLVFQVMPSIVSCVMWTRRAVFLRVEYVDIVVEGLLSLSFLLVLIARWLCRPSRLGIVTDTTTLIDCLSIGSFIGMMFFSCDWPIESADFTTGGRCTSSDEDVITAHTWFSFAFTRSVYVKDFPASLQVLFPQGIQFWFKSQLFSTYRFVLGGNRSKNIISCCKAKCQHHATKKHSSDQRRQIRSDEPFIPGTIQMGDIFSRVRENVALKAVDTDDKSKANASAAAVGSPYNLSHQKTVEVGAYSAWTSPLWMAYRLMFEALMYVFLLACTIYILEIIGEFPAVETGMTGGSTVSRFWSQYECEDGTRVVQPKDGCFETFSPFVSFYYLLITFSTVGFGDFTPTTSASRLATVVFMLVGIAVFAKAATVLSSVLSRQRPRVPPRFSPTMGEFIVILGSPSTPQLHDFLSEIHAVDAEYSQFKRLEKQFGFGRKVRKLISNLRRKNFRAHESSNPSQSTHRWWEKPLEYLSFRSKQNEGNRYTTDNKSRGLFVVILGKLTKHAEKWLLHQTNYPHPLYKEMQEAYQASRTPLEEEELEFIYTGPKREQGQSTEPLSAVDPLSGRASKLHKRELNSGGRIAEGDNSVIYLEGDPTDQFDLSRAALEYASCVFVLPQSDSMEESASSNYSIPTDDYLSLQYTLCAREYLTKVAHEKLLVRIEALQEVFAEISASELRTAFTATNSTRYLFVGENSDDPVSYFRLCLRALLYQYAIDMQLNVRLILSSVDSARHARLSGVPRKNIILKNSFRYALMGASCLFPGMSTLIANLLTAKSPLPAKGDSPSIVEYKQGALARIYSCQVPACLVGLTLGEAACCVFELTGDIRRAYVPANDLENSHKTDYGGMKCTTIHKNNDVCEAKRDRTSAADPVYVNFSYGSTKTGPSSAITLIGCSIIQQFEDDDNYRQNAESGNRNNVALGTYSKELKEGMKIFGMAVNMNMFRFILSSEFDGKAWAWREGAGTDIPEATPQTAGAVNVPPPLGADRKSDNHLSTSPKEVTMEGSPKLLKLLSDLQYIKKSLDTTLTPPSNKELIEGRHLLVVCGPDVAVEHLNHFLQPIWSSPFRTIGNIRPRNSSQVFKSVVVLHPNPPEEKNWRDLFAERARRQSSLPLYVVHGSASSKVDLARSGIFSCSTVAILSSGGAFFNFDKDALANSTLDELTGFLVIRYLKSGDLSTWMIAQIYSRKVIDYLQLDRKTAELHQFLSGQESLPISLDTQGQQWIQRLTANVKNEAQSCRTMSEALTRLLRVMKISRNCSSASLSRKSATFPPALALTLMGYNIRLLWDAGSTSAQTDIKSTGIENVREAYAALKTSFRLIVGDKCYTPSAAAAASSSALAFGDAQLSYALTAVKHEFFYQMCSLSIAQNNAIDEADTILEKTRSTPQDQTWDISDHPFQDTEEYANGTIHSIGLAETVLASSFHEPEVLAMVQQLLHLPNYSLSMTSLQRSTDNLPVIQLITVPPNVWKDVLYISKASADAFLEDGAHANVLDLSLPTYHQVFVYVVSHYNMIPIGLFRHCYMESSKGLSEFSPNPYVYTAPEPDCLVLPTDGIYVVTQALNPLLTACVSLQRLYRSNKCTK